LRFKQDDKNAQQEENNDVGKAKLKVLPFSFENISLM
jgi:hypothetical protein